MRLQKMEACQGIYHYTLLGAFLCGIGVRWEKRRRFFCSHFVGDLLSRSHAAALPKPASLMQPADYVSLMGIRVIYSGSVGELFRQPVCTF
ncbi:MAG: hypothetical protein E7631_01015 [Ruminococcaceae bacterium]|nr:hypothetical protein [Oscillospiraceae bacterium]